MVSYQQEHIPECYNDLSRVRNRHSSFDLRQDSAKFETRRKSLTEDFVKLGLRPREDAPLWKPREANCSDGDVKNVVGNRPTLTSTFADVEALKQQLGKEKRYGSLRRYKLCSEFMAPGSSTTDMSESTANAKVTRYGDNFDVKLLLCENNDRRQSLNLCSSRGVRMDNNCLYGSVRQKYLGNECFSKNPLSQLGELCDNHDGSGTDALELRSPAFESEEAVELPEFSSEVRGSSARFQSGIFCKPRFGRHSIAKSAAVSEHASLTVGQDLGKDSRLSPNFDMSYQMSARKVDLDAKTQRDARRHVLRKHHSASDMAHSFYGLHNEMSLPVSGETSVGEFELGGIGPEINSFQFPSFEDFKRMQQEKSAFSYQRASANCVIPEEELEIQGLNPLSDTCSANPTSTLVSEVLISRVDDDILVNAPAETPSHFITLHPSSSGTSSSRSIDRDVCVRDASNGLISVDANEDVFSDEEIASTGPTPSELQITKDSCNLPGLCVDGNEEEEVADDVGCDADAGGNLQTCNDVGMLPDAVYDSSKLSLSVSIII